jgi:hypothetical protein
VITAEVRLAVAGTAGATVTLDFLVESKCLTSACASSKSCSGLREVPVSCFYLMGYIGTALTKEAHHGWRSLICQPAGQPETATINPARFLGMEKDLGTTEKGKIANLVLLDDNPLTDIHNTAKISEVFLAGKEFDRPALDQMLKSAEAAAKSAAIN